MKQVTVKVSWDDRSGEATVPSSHDDKRAIFEAADRAAGEAVRAAFTPRPPAVEEKPKAKPAPKKRSIFKKEEEAPVEDR